MAFLTLCGLALALAAFPVLRRAARAVARSRYFSEPPERALDRLQEEARILVDSHDREPFERLEKKPLARRKRTN